MDAVADGNGVSIQNVAVAGDGDGIESCARRKVIGVVGARGACGENKTIAGDWGDFAIPVVEICPEAIGAAIPGVGS